MLTFYDPPSYLYSGGRLVVLSPIRTEDGVYTGHTTNHKTYLFHDEELVLKQFVKDGSITQVIYFTQKKGSCFFPEQFGANWLYYQYWWLAKG